MYLAATYRAAQLAAVPRYDSHRDCHHVFVIHGTRGLARCLVLSRLVDEPFLLRRSLRKSSNNEEQSHENCFHFNLQKV